MTRGWIVILGALAAGCPKSSDTAKESGDTAETEETGADDIIWPTGERALLYTGNGGVTGKLNGWGVFDDVDAHWKEVYGWNTDIYDTLPDDLSDYRMIAFAGPGISADDEPFSTEQLDVLRAARDAGTRMIVMTEVDNCAAQTANGLLEGLGVDMRFTGESASEFMEIDATVMVGFQLTDGVSAMSLSDPCFVDFEDADFVVHTEGNVVVAVQRPGRGGDVVAIGDFEFLDDSGPRQYADNAVFADRLVEVVPDYTP